MIGLSAMILVGAAFVPVFLVAAIIRGGLRARRERAALKRLGKDFE